MHLCLCPFIPWESSLEVETQTVVRGASEIGNCVLIRYCTKRLCHDLFGENTLCYKSITYYFYACLKPASIMFLSYKRR